MVTMLRGNEHDSVLMPVSECLAVEVVTPGWTVPGVVLMVNAGDVLVQYEPPPSNFATGRVSRWFPRVDTRRGHNVARLRFV